MGMMRPDWTISITHEPTGITVSTSSECFRTQRRGYDSLISRLKSKLYMMNQMEIDPDDLRLVYYTPSVIVKGTNND